MAMCSVAGIVNVPLEGGLEVVMLSVVVKFWSGSGSDEKVFRTLPTGFEGGSRVYKVQWSNFGVSGPADNRHIKMSRQAATADVVKSGLFAVGSILTSSEGYSSVLRFAILVIGEGSGRFQYCIHAMKRVKAN